jgi:PPOX class probable F420-dependent enzyme
MTGMTADEISAILDQASPPLLGVIATLRADGSPHAVPVWYSWDGHIVSIWTHQDRAWVRNLGRDARVAFTAQQAQPPYGAVIMRGRAETSAPGTDVDGDIRRIVGRYLPERERDGYIAAWSQLHTIVRVHPATIHAWNRGY